MPLRPRSLVAALVLSAGLLAACRQERDDPPAPTEETVRRIVREEAAPLSAETIRQIAREEIARARAAQDAADECEIGIAATRALPSVVRIETRLPDSAIVTSRGTGFAALAGGIVVTAAHVVDDATRVDLITADDRRLSGEVIKRDAVLDLAVVRVTDRGLPAVKWADPATVALGEPVRIIGYPSGPAVAVTGGVLASRIPAMPGGRELLVTDTTVDHGNSGGPLLTRCGEALGVVVERRLTSSAVTTLSVGATTALPFILAAAANSPPATPTRAP